MSMQECSNCGSVTERSISEWGQLIHAWAHDKGFYPHGQTCPGAPCTHASGSFASAVMLIVTELSEAVEGDRRGDRENVVEELADTAIRLLDLCAAEGIDLESAMRAKMEANFARPHKHEKRY